MVFRFNSPILNGYVKKTALYSILLAVLGLWLLQVLFGYLGELESLSESYTSMDALRYMFYRSPKILVETIPTGALLGAVIGLGLLANKSELVVMQASGVSKGKIVSWVLQPAVLFVLLALAINQFILPTSNRFADLANEGQSTLEETVFSVNGYWTVQPSYSLNTNHTPLNHTPLNDKSSNNTGNDKYGNDKVGKEVIFIDYADTEGNIGEVKRWQLDHKGNLQSASMATGGNYVGSIDVGGVGSQDIDLQGNGTNSSVVDFNPHSNFHSKNSILHQWKLSNISQIQIAQSGRQALSTRQTQKVSDIISLPIEPESIYLLTRDAEDLSLTQLYEHRTFMKSQGKRSLEHELAFWQKLLRPFAIFSLVIIACSFVFGSLRTHSLGLRIVVALLFGLFFSYMQDLAGFISLTIAWSPLLMVLLPIIASGLLGVWLLVRRQ